MNLAAAPDRAVRVAGGLTTAGAVLAMALSVHTAVNTRLLRRLAAPTTPLTERVSVLVPARDEQDTLPLLLASLGRQRWVPELEILVLDDGSTDGTRAAVLAAAAADPRIRLLSGAALPPGWLGKPHACRQLAEAATGTALVFVDADVVLEPAAVAAAVDTMRRARLDLLSPYPRQVAVTAAERLVQPLLQWSWLTTLPLRVAERSSRPSLSAANGQFLAVDAAVYTRAGGHAAVRKEVLEDIGLLRAIKRAGGHGAPADGSALASCRMYRSWPEVRDGYAKSLWAAFGSRPGAVAVFAALGLAYVLPPVAALTGSRIGLLGYAAAVAGRVMSGRASGARTWPDALAHPASIVVAGWLTALSWRRKRLGRISWKGRSIA